MKPAEIRSRRADIARAVRDEYPKARLSWLGSTLFVDVSDRTASLTVILDDEGITTPDLVNNVLDRLWERLH